MRSGVLTSMAAGATAPSAPLLPRPIPQPSFSPRPPEVPLPLQGDREASPAPSPSRSTHPTAGITAPEGPLPSPTAPPVQKITPAEGKTLLKEFKRAQSNETKALEHRQKIEMTELKASHSARQTEWENRERELRRKYFAEHDKGADKRAYMHDLRDRRNAFFALLADERTQRQHDQEVRRKSVKDDQESKLKEFSDFLQREERPPQSLWPSGQ